MFLFFVIVVVGFVIYSMKPEERAKALATAVALIHRLKADAVHRMEHPEPHEAALRERTRWPLVTAALLLLNVVTFLRMASAAGAVGDPATQLAWGANFGPITTNGEWRRLLVSTFVHPGLVSLIVTMAALAQVGPILERLVGHATFALVYLAAAVIGSTLDLYTHPLSINGGPTTAIVAIYGLMAGTSVWNLMQPTAVTIPPKAMTQFAPAAGILLLYMLAGGYFASGAPIAGLAIGATAGLAMTRGIGNGTPSLRLVGQAAVAALLLAVVLAFPLRGISDVRPEIARIVEFEGRAAGIYEKAVEQFRLGAIKAEALAQIIDRSIMPELQAAQGRMKAFEGDNIPTEYRPLVEGANEYLRLRDESWRLRSEALRKANMSALRKADRAEWESLEAFSRLKANEQTDTSGPIPDQQKTQPKDQQTKQ